MTIPSPRKLFEIIASIIIASCCLAGFFLAVIVLIVFQAMEWVVDRARMFRRRV